MPFLTATDFNTHVDAEIVNAITNGQTNILPAAINAAIAEAKGYMSRYAYETIFANTADARDPILLMYVKNMARWHFIALANPNIDYEDTKQRYADAIKWLDKVQQGKIAPIGWPPATLPIDTDTFFHIRGNEKRNNYR